MLMSPWNGQIIVGASIFGIKDIIDVDSLPNFLKTGDKFSCSRSFKFSEKPDFLPDQSWEKLGEGWKMSVKITFDKNWGYDVLIVGTNLEKIEEEINKVNFDFDPKKKNFNDLTAKIAFKNPLKASVSNDEDAYISFANTVSQFSKMMSDNIIKDLLKSIENNNPLVERSLMSLKNNSGNTNIDNVVDKLLMLIKDNFDKPNIIEALEELSKAMADVATEQILIRVKEKDVASIEKELMILKKLLEINGKSEIVDVIQELLRKIKNI